MGPIDVAPTTHRLSYRTTQARRVGPRRTSTIKLKVVHSLSIVGWATSPCGGRERSATAPYRQGGH